MGQHSQTIEIFLPDGEPRGLRLAGITTRIVQAVQCPRGKLDRLFARPEARRVSLYLLFGTDSDGGDAVYIGQTEDLVTRLKSHHANKDFWRTVVAVSSRTESFTQVHVRYLEWLSIDAATHADRYQLDNGNAGGKPYIPEPLEADVNDAFDTASTLIATLGFPVFDRLLPIAASTRQDKVFRCVAKRGDARGILVDDGFVVLKGSSFSREVAPSVPNVLTKQQELMQKGLLVDAAEGRYELAEDYLFSSPSLAAATVSGASTNGWVKWKDENGRTLDEIYRAETE